MKNNKKGFTLIELVIIIAVLAVIAAIAIPTTTKIIGQANDKTDKANFALAQAAMEQYYSENSSYPANITTAQTAVKSMTKDGTVPSCKVSGYKFYYVYADFTGHKTGDVVYANANPGTAGTNCDALN